MRIYKNALGNFVNSKAGRLIFISAFTMLFFITGSAAAICSYGKKDETRKADAAVVLGAGVWKDEPSPVFRERLNHGVWLYQNRYVKTLILTGGRSEGSFVSDAQIAKNYVVRQGVPAEDIQIEEQSTITMENLIYTKQIMDEQGFKSVLIVSDPLHMKRSMLMAADIGIEAFTSPTPTTRYVSLKSRTAFLAREVFFYCGYQVYRIFD